MVKYSKHFLTKLEDLFAETEYILRYEKGSFSSGYCIMKDVNIVIVNKFLTLEGRINALIEIIKTLEFDTKKFTDKNIKFYQELMHYLKPSSYQANI